MIGVTGSPVAVMRVALQQIEAGADWVKMYGSTGSFENVTGDQTFSFHSGGPVFPGRTSFDLDSNQVTLRVNIMLGRLGHFGP